MSYVIQSGSTNKADVFSNRLRTFDTNTSLLNHISLEPNKITKHPEENPNVGVYTVRNFISTTLVTTHKTLITLGIINNDPNNLLIVDRMYAQVVNYVSAAGNLPDSRVTVRITTSLLTANIPFPPFNDNQSTTVIPIPDITILGNVPSNAVDPTTFYSISPTKGDIIDLIHQGSDSIILKPVPFNPIATFKNNAIGIMLVANHNTNKGVAIESFIRFMIVPPEIG